jgi:hypothetical protein
MLNLSELQVISSALILNTSDLINCYALWGTPLFGHPNANRFLHHILQYKLMQVRYTWHENVTHCYFYIVF